MSKQLKISVGQFSDRGCKETNQDFHGAYIPKEPQLSSKGIAIAIADGISSSDVSHIASESAVGGLLEDYYCTSEAWSVKTSVERVLSATNSWLYSQTQQGHGRYDKDRGFVCTLSAMVIKSATAHIFHVGDTRIYQLHNQALEQLTTDHRVWVSSQQSHLSRAVGINGQLEIDYRTVSLEPGDIFLLATDGVYEFTDAGFISATLKECGSDLDKAAKAIVVEAYERGSKDNLSLQIVRIDELPELEAKEMYQQYSELPFPPILEPRMDFDGYKIVREVHGTSRSHIYLAVDSETGETVIIKTPSIDLQNNPEYLERFLMEEWVARRINSAHVLKPCSQTRKRNFVYLVTEFIDGQTLAQWMIDNPKPSVETVRGIVEQIAKGLRAFHRLEMLHQDLRPENIMIDSTGTVKIIDFGATKVAGISEAAPLERNQILGTEQYAAPEYFLGEEGTTRSDIFSLGVITYQMLSGRLPYGANVSRSRTKEAQNKLMYDSVLDDKREIPAWIDGMLKKAVHVNPAKRYSELSEFIYDLRHPNVEFLKKTRPALIDRNPLMFWKSVSFILAVIVIVLLKALQKS
ncbi:MAG: bifunctional protein-serine/threonine kinase/phosphatase [Burkholderiales bacterium]|nr:bifunctional protein-serine/threonine kinase/phosphatase [Burkholderiales bacterium]